MQTEGSVQIVLVTAPADAAEELAKQAVESRLAACANLLGPVKSVFRWDGAVQIEQEVLLMIKTTSSAYPELEKMLQRAHPYDVPEILPISTSGGLSSYVQWVFDEVKI